MFKRRDIFICGAIFLVPVVFAFVLKEKAAFLIKKKEASPYMKTIEDLKNLEVLWLDARTEKKFRLKHIPKAILIDSHDWESSLERLFTEVVDLEVTMVVYCSAGCPSSQSIARRLREELSKENIYFLKGGMPAWFAAQE